MISIVPVQGIPEIQRGDDLAKTIEAALRDQGEALGDGDIVVVTHKIVSKAEGAVVTCLSDDDYRAIVDEQATSIIRRRGDLVIAVTSHGYVCANAGVDRSNTPGGTAVLLPADPDASAHELRMRLERSTGAAIGVIITDTFGRAWRRGVVDIALGVSGVPAVVDLKGSRDADGRELVATEIGLADEIAAAADLAMGKDRAVPVAIVRGIDAPWPPGRGADLVRPPVEDLFR